MSNAKNSLSVVKNKMKPIVHFLFEAHILKSVQRTGYQFLGTGHESVAEHSFMIAMIAFTMSKLNPAIDPLKIISMALVHDLPEARMGELNYVHQRYTTAHEDKALNDLAKQLPFGQDIVALVNEFNEGQTEESRLAKDADQLSLILELKALHDQGNRGPEKWLQATLKRLKTDLGKQLAETIMSTEWDEWWFQALPPIKK
ncbi:MAG: Metal dependent phosphohydrolase [Candidatus Magnetoglobus multicellularis str. Araruama]|uniref:5'-deoxynucleotidase n=1 Tax=Candidatus Magnetoglobus multicellularis str. Araruama TaxID=890399 RepID=A0A1V1PIS7_9BACT|nr:MAG: Metal dependent phosphohydrolase [Candidatus Magnetoglobus multicellularis str. Araruama]